MKLFEIFEDTLLELYLASNFAPLYHGTTLENASKILHDGKITVSPNHKNLSLTRNPNLWFGRDKIGGGQVQFVINQNALRSQYKIKPHSYYDTRQVDNESEETVFKDIPITSKFVSKILISTLVLVQINNPNAPNNVRVYAKIIVNKIKNLAEGKGIPIEFVNKSK